MLYHGQYWDSNKSEFSLKSDYTDPISMGKKRNWVSQYRYCESYFNKDKKTILEIGAGAGQASFWFEEKGFFVTAIEPDIRPNRYYRIGRTKHRHVFISFFFPSLLFLMLRENLFLLIFAP